MDESGGSGTKRNLSNMTPMGPSSSTELPRRQPLRIVSSFSPERQHPMEERMDKWRYIISYSH